MPTHAKDFTQRINSFHHRRPYEVFSDWLEIAAATIHQAPYHAKFAPIDDAYHTVEAHYMTAIKKYTRNELNTFAELLAITQMALAESYCDFLGSWYMSAELANSRTGEFFTPYELSLMTAKMLMGDVSTLIQDKGFLTLAEPASGAGGMIIAAAQVIAEQGHDPSKVMFFDATDISAACYHMTYLQTSILGLSGYVRHGNTLTLDHWEGRFTSACRIYPWRTQKFLSHLKQPDTDQPIDPPSPGAPHTLPAQPTPPEHPQQFTLFDSSLPPGRRAQVESAHPAITTRTRRPTRQLSPTQSPQPDLFTLDPMQ